MGLASGVHHLAISTADLKGQLEFFTDVLGAELKALYWMHGVPGAKHAFVKLNDSSYIAFVHMPPIEGIPTELGVTHSGNPAGDRAAVGLGHFGGGEQFDHRPQTNAAPKRARPCVISFACSRGYAQ